MPTPYLLMTLLYLSVGVLMALDSSLVSLDVLPWFNGLRWLRVHFITLGMLVEAAFGLLPVIVAARSGRPRPGTRWDVWLALNAGLLTLLAGIPLVNGALIVAGGTLIFVSAVLLFVQVSGLRRTASIPGPGVDAPTGFPFYLAGSAFLLLGIAAGTGLWLGWGEALRMASIKEVHLHANLWGFTSLTFAGLLVDLYPHFSGRSLAWPRSIGFIFGAMLVGDLGLVAGPWLGLNAITVPSLLLHHAATAGLLVNVVRPLADDRAAWGPGTMHLVAGYLWILSPVLAAPFVMMSGIQPPQASLEGGGPAFLVYGWVLQVGIALVPYLFARLQSSDQPPRLGGNWLSLVAVHAGIVPFVAGLFLESQQSWLHGLAYGTWALAIVSMMAGLWRIVGASPGQPETDLAMASD